MAKKRFTMRDSKMWQLVGLAALALVTFGVVAFALMPAKAPAVASQPVPIPSATQTVAPRPDVAFLGDSYTTGAGASAGHGWTTLLSKSEGWTEKSFGVGGTNYASAGSLEGGSSYVDRVARVVAAAPDVVIVSSSGDELGSDQTGGIKATFEALRKGLPKAQIIALSPFWKAEAFPPQLETVAGQIMVSVESIHGTFVDISNPLQGHPDLLDPDGIHPNNAGHALIAKDVKAALDPVLKKAKG